MFYFYTWEYIESVNLVQFSRDNSSFIKNPGESHPLKKKQLLPIKVANKILFVLVLMTLFFVPVIPLTLHYTTYDILITSIILTGTQLISKNRKLILTYAILAIAMVWLGVAMDLHVINSISKGINVVLFIFIVLDLVKQVSHAKMVSPKVILESIIMLLLP